MQLDLTRYRQPIEHFARTFKPGEVAMDAEDEFRVVAPVQLDFDIHKDKEKFRLEGRVRTQLELSCSRCLEGFRFPLDAAFDVRYLPASQMSAEDEREIGAEDLET